MSSFKNLEEAKTLASDSKKLFHFHDQFREATKKGNSGNVDKFKKGFNADDRFKSFSANVYFSAYSGYYGSSSVGKFINLSSGKHLNEALISYLNENEEAVIKGIATILERKAKSFISEAKKEVADASTAIQSISSGVYFVGLVADASTAIQVIEAIDSK